jgi:hypothetical protein
VRTLFGGVGPTHHVGSLRIEREAGSAGAHARFLLSPLPRLPVSLALQFLAAAATGRFASPLASFVGRFAGDEHPTGVRPLIPSPPLPAARNRTP